MIVHRYQWFIMLTTALIAQGFVNPSAQLVKITNVNPHIRLDIRYATTNNFTGKTIYTRAECYMVKPAAEALDKVQEELEAEGLGLKIFDGYRPLSAQYVLWNALSTLYPNEKERALYVANPEIGSQHNRGAAVDVTLVTLTNGKALPMPSRYDDFSDKAHRNYDKMPSDEVRKNCQELEDVMKKHEFIPLSSEWWHFDFKGWKKYPIQDVSFEELNKERQ